MLCAAPMGVAPDSGCVGSHPRPNAPRLLRVGSSFLSAATAGITCINRSTNDGAGPYDGSRASSCSGRCSQPIVSPDTRRLATWLPFPAPGPFRQQPQPPSPAAVAPLATVAQSISMRWGRGDGLRLEPAGVVQFTDGTTRRDGEPTRLVSLASVRETAARVPAMARPPPYPQAAPAVSRRIPMPWTLQRALQCLDATAGGPITAAEPDLSTAKQPGGRALPLVGPPPCSFRHPQPGASVRQPRLDDDEASGLGP